MRDILLGIYYNKWGIYYWGYTTINEGFMNLCFATKWRISQNGIDICLLEMFPFCHATNHAWSSGYLGHLPSRTTPGWFQQSEEMKPWTTGVKTRYWVISPNAKPTIGETLSAFFAPSIFERLPGYQAPLCTDSKQCLYINIYWHAGTYL